MTQGRTCPRVLVHRLPMAVKRAAIKQDKRLKALRGGGWGSRTAGLAGTELILLPAAGTGLYFGFSIIRVLITCECSGCC